MSTKQPTVANMVGKLYQCDATGACYEVAAANEQRVTFFQQGGGFHRIMQTQTFMALHKLVSAKPKFEEVLITADWLDEGVMIPAYADGSRWNGWAIPHFGEEGVLKLLSLLPNLRRINGVLELLDTEPLSEWERIEPRVINVNGCDILTFPVGAQSWCWDSLPQKAAKSLTIKSVFMHHSPEQTEYHDIQVYVVLSDTSEWRFAVSVEMDTGNIYDGEICYSANNNAVFDDAPYDPPHYVVDAFRAKRIEAVLALQKSYSLRTAWKRLTSEDTEFMTAMLEELVERRVTKTKFDLYWQFRALGESSLIFTAEMEKKVNEVLAALTPPATLIEVPGLVESAKIISDESVESAFKAILKMNL